MPLCGLQLYFTLPLEVGGSTSICVQQIDQGDDAPRDPSPGRSAERRSPATLPILGRVKCGNGGALWVRTSTAGGLRQSQ